MSLLLVDDKSMRAYATRKQELFFFDGISGKSGELVIALEKEPNQIQGEFGNDQVAVACWNLGLLCYSVKERRLVWRRDDLPRVAAIVFSEASNTYFIRSEDTFATLCVNSTGESVTLGSEYCVLGAFNQGRYLVTITPNRFWKVVSVDGSTVTDPRRHLKEPVLAISGNSDLVAFGPLGGCIEIHELRRGESVFQIKRKNWFNVPSIIQTRDPMRFRALVTDWDNRPVGAVIDIDIREREFSLVSVREEWNWNAKLLDHGEAVLRYFDEGPEKFVITRL